jgi:hypothetical protein
MEVSSMALTDLDQSDSQVYIHNFEVSFNATPQLALGSSAFIQRLPAWKKLTSPSTLRST